MNVQVGQAARELIDARLRAGDTVRFTITTTSMYPTLAPGDEVIVGCARGEELRVGDVVILKPTASAAWLVHRLIARRAVDGRVRFVTKGDNCAAPDPLWTESQLCGIVIATQSASARTLTDWRTRRARGASAWLALVSRAQAHALALPHGGIRRVALRVSRGAMQASAFIARWVMR